MVDREELAEEERQLSVLDSDGLRWIANLHSGGQA